MSKASAVSADAAATSNNKGLLKRISYYKYFYIMMIPAIIYFLIFHYVPMYGLSLAFREFSYNSVFGGEWVGLKYFNKMLGDVAFRQVLYNTVFIGLGRLVFEFPVPIFLALLLNELRSQKYKKTVQVILTFPHFVSWVVAAGIVTMLLNDAGVVNQIAVFFGFPKINLLTQPSVFRALIFGSNNWKEMGWGTIIYLATISSINPEYYEAARIDGANRFQMMRFITWPAMKSIMAVLLILQVAETMNYGFDQIFNLYNPVVYSVADILDTYIYRITFKVGQSFSYSTAFGMFKSVINLILLFTANQIAKRINGEGIF